MMKNVSLLKNAKEVKMANYDLQLYEESSSMSREQSVSESMSLSQSIVNNNGSEENNGNSCQD